MNKHIAKRMLYIFAFAIFIFYLAFSKVLFLDIFPGEGVNPVKIIDSKRIIYAAQSDEISLANVGLSQEADSMRRYCTYSNTLVLGKDIKLNHNKNVFFILYGEKKSYSVELKTKLIPSAGSSYNIFSKFSTHKIEPGDYRTGVLFINDSGKEYICWEGYTVKKPDEIILQKYLGKWVDNLPDPEQLDIGKLNYYMDGAKNVQIDEKNYLCVFGWVFITDMDTNKQQVFIEVVDSNDNKRFRQAVAPIFRPGFAELFKSIKYSMAGFEAYIPAEQIKNGNYKIRIIVKNNDILATHAGYYNLQYSESSSEMLPITAIEIK